MRAETALVVVLALVLGTAAGLAWRTGLAGQSYVVSALVTCAVLAFYTLARLR